MKTLLLASLATLFALLSCGSTVVHAEEAPSFVEEVERKALDYRRKIATGHVVFTAISNYSTNESQQMRYSVTFDRDLTRFSWVGRMRETDDWSQPHMTTIAEHEYFSNSPPPVSVTINFNSRAPKIREQYQVLDPRALGMDVNPISSIARNGFENLLNRADRKTPEISSAVFEGQATWLIKYVTTGGKEVQMWIAPEQGYGLVHAETKIDSPNGLNGPLIFTVTSKLKRYPDGNIWYPARIENRSTIDGKPNASQVVEVDEAKFNTKIDPATFTLAGLGLEVGRPISDGRGKRGLQEWDGKEAVEVMLPQTPPDPPRPIGPRRPNKGKPPF